MKQLASILTIVFLYVLAFEVMGFSSTAQAQTSTHAHEAGTVPGGYLKDIWGRDKLTGDWGGLRSDLSKHGIDIGLRLSQYWQRVASGGVDVNSEYGGTMDYRVNADLRKLFGLWEGFSVNMHARTRFGSDVSADAGSFVLENAGLLMQLPGDYGGTDITGLTITQSLFDGRADVFFGKLDVIDLVTGFFPQLGYGQEGFWNVNSLVSALPWFGSVQGLSLWGGGAWTIKDEMVQGGFIFAGTANVSTSWDVSPSSMKVFSWPGSTGISGS